MAVNTSKHFFSSADDLGTDIVDIFVGAKRKRFVVHKQLLLSQSPYFQKTLDELTEDSPLHLEDEDPAAVALLVGWLYRGILSGVAEMENEIKAPILKQKWDFPAFGTATKSGMSLVPFNPVVTLDEAGPNLIQHVGFHTGFAALSPEEIRARHYATEEKQPSSVITPNKPVAPPAFGSSVESNSTQESATPNPPIDANHKADREALQSALLQLCLLGEKLQWPAVFNIAIESYDRINGPQQIQSKDVELIYQKSTTSSTLRLLVMDNIERQEGGNGHLAYTDLAMRSPDLLKDIFNKLRVPLSMFKVGSESPFLKLSNKYHMSK